MIQNVDIVDKEKYLKYELQDRVNMYIDFYTTLLNYKKFSLPNWENLAISNGRLSISYPNNSL